VVGYELSKILADLGYTADEVRTIARSLFFCVDGPGEQDGPEGDRRGTGGDRRGPEGDRRGTGGGPEGDRRGTGGGPEGDRSPTKKRPLIFVRGFF